MLRVEDELTLQRYLHTSENGLIVRPLKNRKIGEEPKFEHHAAMSLSDFELVESEINGELLVVTEPMAIASLEGVSGHEITYIFTELLREFRTNDLSMTSKKIGTITRTRDGLRPHEKPIIELARNKVLGDKAITVDDIPEVAFDIWKLLKSSYIFYKKPKGSTLQPLYDGNEFNAEWVRHQWLNGFEHKAFEEAVIGIHSLKLKRYLEQDWFRDRFSLPFESTPWLNVETEASMYFQVNHGDFGIQNRAQADWVVTQEGKNWVTIIDQKFGSPDKLDTPASRMQALGYSIGAKGKGRSWYVEQLDPKDVSVFYQVYDFDSSSYYYLDATITPEEYPKLLEKYYYYSYFWHQDLKYFKEAKAYLEHALVAPHLPYPDELEKLHAGFIEPRRKFANA